MNKSLYIIVSKESGEIIEDHTNYKQAMVRVRTLNKFNRVFKVMFRSNYK